MGHPLRDFVDVQFRQPSREIHGIGIPYRGREGHFPFGNRVPRTEAERALYEAFKQDGIKAIPQYKFILKSLTIIVDFAIPEKKIVVECDSRNHNTKKQREKDLLRDKTLWGYGWRTVRLSNDKIMNDIDECISIVKDEIDSWS